MYAFVDQPLVLLDHGGRLLAIAMRQWVAAMHMRQRPEQSLLPLFARARIVDALPHFDRMMTILNLHARRNLSFAPVRCCRIAEDEAVLLALATDIAHRAPDDITATLSLIVNTGHVAPLHAALSLLVARLDAEGLHPRAPRHIPTRPRQTG